MAKVNQSILRKRGGTLTGSGGPPGAPLLVMPPAVGLGGGGGPGLPPGGFESAGFPSPSGFVEFFLLINYRMVLLVTGTGAAVERLCRSFVQSKVAVGQTLFSI